MMTTMISNKAVRAALPPGYESRLFCPPGYCVGRRHPGPGVVGPKSLFWECRAGDGSPRAAEKWELEQSVGVAIENRKPATVEVSTWGPRLQNADGLLDDYQSRGFSDHLCTTLHAPPLNGGVHTVYVPDDDAAFDPKTGEVHRIGFLGMGDGGEEDGIGTRTILLGSASMVCFVLFCFVSSALNMVRARENDKQDDRRV